MRRLGDILSITATWLVGRRKKFDPGDWVVHPGRLFGFIKRKRFKVAADKSFFVNRSYQASQHHLCLSPAKQQRFTKRGYGSCHKWSNQN